MHSNSTSRNLIFFRNTNESEHEEDTLNLTSWWLRVSFQTVKENIEVQKHMEEMEKQLAN